MTLAFQGQGSRGIHPSTAQLATSQLLTRIYKGKDDATGLVIEISRLVQESHIIDKDNNLNR